jgi:hypothetical protein
LSQTLSLLHALRLPHKSYKQTAKEYDLCVLSGSKGETRGEKTINMDDSKRDRGASSEYVRMYYEHQYDRMAKLEDQRLIVTNIVITLSVVAFTFGFQNTQGLTTLTGLGLPVVLALVNLSAIGYIVHTANVIKAHRGRARRVLELYAKELYQLDQSIQWSHRLWERWKIQLLIHIVLILISLFPIYIYLRGII